MDIDRMEFKVNNLKERVEELCDKSSAYVRYIVLSVLGLVISLGNIISNMYLVLIIYMNMVILLFIC